MKANRKFKKEEDEAVSAVIGVILMVAITVAIAATVYVYVTQMMPDSGSSSPQITLSQNEPVASTGGNYVNFSVSSASASAKWTDMQVKIGDVTLSFESSVDAGAFTGKTGNIWAYNGSNEPIKAGDTLYCHVSTQITSGDKEIKIIHTPSNSAIASKTIT